MQSLRRRYGLVGDADPAAVPLARLAAQLSLEEILDDTPLQMVTRELVPPFGLFKMMTFRKL